MSLAAHSAQQWAADHVLSAQMEIDEGDSWSEQADDAGAEATAAAASTHGKRLGMGRLPPARPAAKPMRRPATGPAIRIASPPPTAAAAAAPSAASAERSLEERWVAAIADRADALFETFWHSVRNHRHEYNKEDQRARILQNVSYQVMRARAVGCTPPHRAARLGGCPGQFVPETFFDLTEFAHNDANKVSTVSKKTGKSGDSQKHYQKCRNGSCQTYREFHNNGNAKWAVCHKQETQEQNTQRTKPTAFV